jgi:hypothetical protein
MGLKHGAAPLKAFAVSLNQSAAWTALQIGNEAFDAIFILVAWKTCPHELQECEAACRYDPCAPRRCSFSTLNTMSLAGVGTFTSRP